MPSYRESSIGILKGNSYEAFLRQKYANLKFSYVRDHTEGLKLLAFGEVESYVGDIGSISYRIKQKQINNLKLAFDTGIASNGAIASRNDWPILHSILVKGLHAITPEERERINKRWITLNPDDLIIGEVLRYLLIVIIPLILILVLVLIWTRSLKFQVARRTSELKSRNEELQRTEAQLRESQEDLNAILTSLDDIIFVINENYEFLNVWAVNEASLLLPKERYLGKSLPTLFGPKFSKPFVEAIRKVIKKGNTVAIEYQSPDPDSDKWYNAKINLIKLDNYPEKRVTMLVRDITERKMAESQVAILNAQLDRRVRERTMQLEATNKELEAFSYSVSHDLRAPLRAIDGFSRILQEDCAGLLNDNDQDYLKRISLATQRMSQLIDDLLKLSRITRSEIKPVSINLSALAEKIISELQANQPERKVEVVIEPDLLIVADLNLMEIVLANLIENAWKFTQHKAVTRIEFGCKHEGGLVFFITDNGAGFDMNYSDKLFGAFQRLHTVDEFEGTGIGLATVQRIIHRHGGRVWAEGVVEQGATFFFTIG